MSNPIRDYCSQLIESLENFPIDSLIQVTDILAEARVRGSRIYIMGNGGSSSTASHFTSDLNKGAICPGKPRLKVHCLNDNVPVMTAWANDTNFSRIFAEQIENFVKPGDVVIAISVGGNSPNIVEGIRAAKTKGAYCIGFIGIQGGELKTLADTAVIVPNGDTERVEDLHLITCHMITYYLRQFK